MPIDSFALIPLRRCSRCRLPIVAALGAMLCFGVPQARAAALDVRVGGLEDASEGVLIVALYDTTDAFLEDRPQAVWTVLPSVVHRVVFTDLPPERRFILRAFHDLDRDGRPTRDATGRLLEPLLEGVAMTGAQGEKAEVRMYLEAPEDATGPAEASAPYSVALRGDAPDAAQERAMDADAVSRQSPPGEPAATQTRPSHPPWSAGVFALFKTERYAGVSSRLVAFPALTYRGRRLQVLGPNVRYRLWHDAAHELWTTGIYRFDGYSGGDSARLEGLPRRRDTLEGGLRAVRRLSGAGNLTLEVTQELLDEHGGQRAEIALERGRFVRGCRVGAQTSIAWMSGETAEYYFGVAPAHARDDRPAYSPGDAAFSGRLGLSALVPMGGWNLISGMSMHLDSPAIADSPIVDGVVRYSFMLSMTYAF